MAGWLAGWLKHKQHSAVCTLRLRLPQKDSLYSTLLYSTLLYSTLLYSTGSALLYSRERYLERERSCLLATAAGQSTRYDNNKTIDGRSLSVSLCLSVASRRKGARESLLW